jgi:hypothetical protein
MSNFVIISTNPVPGTRPDQVMQWCYDLEEAKEAVKNMAEDTQDEYHICECRSSYVRKWVGQ